MPGEFTTRCFIPSRLEDNPALREKDPRYEVRLQTLPKHLREMWRWGNWDIVAGAIFDNWSPARHVFRPFKVPPSWKIYRAMDWGSARPFSIGWWAIDYDGRLWRVGEWYGWSGKANEGCRLPARTVALRALEYERKRWGKGRVQPGPADPSCWNQVDPGQPSVAETMADVGFAFERGNHDRIQGLQELYSRLSWDPKGQQRPGLCVFQFCQHFIRTVPVLVPDETKPEDVDTDLEDHVYDEARYMVMFAKSMKSYTPAEVGRRRNEKVFDPLDETAGY